ncbi:MULTISPECIES: serine/threonine-protein kinase [Gordonia]|uniref:non-specific serine/threonine protein kinase n=1 Tax=Gordonia amicalis TaxID=89053 RepID=A0ABU4DBI1_9ACTN|nr:MULTISPECIES: serine/threonine-protein kinase [Gordonia]KAF0967844.1 Serine/threonine-protein kinase PknD [Gordonia sp. YY1]MBA5847015.1 protein kinase [Gordonia amicalis]MCZ0911913.1 protein kinase [Gordonia amicalis]MDV6307080.1 protein kinase [Gordonia amicalis]MDV7102426.1 protein kinase [Gordonia amicalis]
MPRNPGEHFAGYTIIRLIGRGGMGEIYLARHPHLPRNEALKVLPAELSRDPMYRQRFVKEAEHASSVVHPSIVTIFNSGEYDGHLWIAMEFIDGIDALKLLRKTPQGLDPQTVIAIVRSVGAALDRAHATGLLHRDVKPANILLQGLDSPEPRVLLADFGIAKSEQDVSHLTSTNVFLGTVAYAAPEQLLGDTVDGRADQYALAATVFELLTGRPPFQGSGTASIIAHHLQSMPPRLSSLRPGISPAADAVFSRALAKEPERRYRSCREFGVELERALTTPDPPKLSKGPPLPAPGSTPGPGIGAPYQRPGSHGPQQPPRAAQPPYGGQPSYAGASPGTGSPGYSPGQPPPGSYPGGYQGYPSQPGYPTPPPGKKGSGVLIALGALALVLVLAIVGGIVYVATKVSSPPEASGTSTTNAAGPTESAGTTPGQSPAARTTDTTPLSVTGPDDVQLGECVSIAMQAGSSTTVLASKVDCDSSGMNFYTASIIPASTSCASEQNSTLTFPNSTRKLCLTPNFYQGLCYLIPKEGGSLSDYREVPCTSAPALRTVLARVSTRATSSVTCATGEARWTFFQPESIGYCLVEI